MMKTTPSKKHKTVHIDGSRQVMLSKARGRLVFLSFMFVLFFILMAARVTDLALIQGYVRSENNRDVIAAHSLRANIVDRNGVLLATSLKTASLFADPHLISDIEDVALDLVEMFSDMAYGDVLQKLQRSSRFVWLKRNLTPAEQYKVLELGHPGLGFKDEYRRIYPQEKLAAHIVGYTDIDGVGLAGIERSFNKLLMQGKDDLFLTLDVRLQHVLRREVQKAVADFRAKGGAGAIVDITNGEILAAVSLPDFDPHFLAKTNPQDLFNRLTQGVYEMGSTFKIFSTAALLEYTDARMNTQFDARKSLERGGYTISDFHAKDRILTVPEIFMYSSNIGAALMGEKIGTERLKDFYADLGLFNKLPIEIGEVGRPLFPETWRDINTLTASFGHGIAVSPLQLIVAASAIVGGGIYMPPTLILRKSANGGDADDEYKQAVVRLVSDKTSHRMRQLMRLVVAAGTGRQANVPGYVVGGKTGTAEKAGKNGYDTNRLISSFIGMFPMNAPHYAVFVMVDEPKGTRASFGYATGGWVAAPAVGRIIKGMVAVLGIEPQTIAPENDLAAPLHAYIKDKKKGAHLVSY